MLDRDEAGIASAPVAELTEDEVEDKSTSQLGRGQGRRQGLGFCGTDGMATEEGTPNTNLPDTKGLQHHI